MKNRCLRLLLTISCAVLMQAATSAAPLPRSSERSANETGDQPKPAATERSVVRGRASRISAGPGSPIKRERLVPTRPWNQPATPRLVTPQVKNKSIGHASIAPLRGVPGSNVRHHGSNPAVIGGSANSDGRSTGGLKGTRMPRRP